MRRHDLHCLLEIQKVYKKLTPSTFNSVFHTSTFVTLSHP